MAGASCLIVTWDGGGNVPPALALGARLLRRGHHVRLLGSGPIEDRARALGLEFESYASVAPWPPGTNLDDVPEVFEDVLSGPGVTRDVQAAIEAAPPDVIIVDCMMCGPLVAAESSGIPTVLLVHILYQPYVTLLGQFLLDTSKPRAALGLPPLECPSTLDLMERLSLVLALVPREFDFPDAPRTRSTHYVGPIFDPRPVERHWDSPWDPTDDRPLVVTSFSTTPMGQERALPPVLDALGQLPVRGLVTLGGVLSASSFSTPDNVTIRDYVPHAAVFGDAAVVVSHGGLSTVMASLTRGVPLVCIPQGRDQGLNGDRVVACGAGVSLPRQATPDVIAQAIGDVLADPDYRQAAGSLGNVIGGLGGGEPAVDLLEELVC
jgi:UDP:flavonoid glycosyltransferase YjiC (YdhE family)